MEANLNVAELLSLKVYPHTFIKFIKLSVAHSCYIQWNFSGSNRIGTMKTYSNQRECLMILVLYMRCLQSKISFFFFFFFSFSVFSDWRSLKIENENKNMET